MTAKFALDQFDGILMGLSRIRHCTSICYTWIKPGFWKPVRIGSLKKGRAPLAISLEIKVEKLKKCAHF